MQLERKLALTNGAAICHIAIILVYHVYCHLQIWI